MSSDDKDELLLNDLAARHGQPDDASNNVGSSKSEAAAALKKSKKVLEAGKAA